MNRTESFSSSMLQKRARYHSDYWKRRPAGNSQMTSDVLHIPWERKYMYRLHLRRSPSCREVQLMNFFLMWILSRPSKAICLPQIPPRSQLHFISDYKYTFCLLPQLPEGPMKTRVVHLISRNPAVLKQLQTRLSRSQMTGVDIQQEVFAPAKVVKPLRHLLYGPFYLSKNHKIFRTFAPRCKRLVFRL